MQDTCKYCRICLQCIPNEGQKAKKKGTFSQPATFTSGPTISKRGQQLFSNNVLKKCRGGILCRQFKCPNRPTGPQRDAAAAGTPNCGSISSSSLNGPVEIFLGTFSTLKVVFLLEITYVTRREYILNWDGGVVWRDIGKCQSHSGTCHLSAFYQNFT